MKKQRRRWMDWELQLLRQSYATYRSEAIAAVLGRPVGTVHQKAAKLGLAKDRAAIAQWAREELQDPDHGFRRAQFAKGHVPANKGTRRAGFAPGRMAETQFKKGAKPHTWVPVGSYRTNGDGNLERKVNDLPGPNHVRWHPVHRLVWEAAHGPVPPGHVVTFKPGRRTTELNLITLDAVELITRRERMTRNSVHTVYPPELARVARLRGLLTRAINRKAKEAETP
jgi:hypothetical protein